MCTRMMGSVPYRNSGAAPDLVPRMSLTLGSGPFAARRAGVFNFDIDAASPKHTIYIEAVPQRIRAVAGGETVIDTRRAKVLYESNIAGQWYVPAADVRADLLTP